VNEAGREPAVTAVVQPGAEPAEVGMALPLLVAEPEPSTSPSDGERFHHAEPVSAPSPSTANMGIVMESGPSTIRPPPRPLPTELRAMCDKGKGVARPTLEERLSTPIPTRPRAGKLPLASRLSNPAPSLVDRLSSPQSSSLLGHLAPPPSNTAGPSSSSRLPEINPPQAPRKTRKARPTLTDFLASQPDTSVIPQRFMNLLHHEMPPQDGRQHS
jgi:hypothetical protein